MIMTNKNTRKNATSNKYWENETPIITETNFGEVHYFKEAGKIQLYPVYEDKDGELKLGRACVWDNNDMEADDAVRLVYALMQGLIDVGVENDAFSDAYSLLGDYINENPIDEDDEEEESDDVTLDEEFEDEEYDYSEMSLAELKELCFEREIEIPKRTSTKTLIKLLEAYDADNADDEDDDEEEEIETKFVGKNLVYEDGKVRKANKKVRKVYLDWAEDVIEWANYIAEEIAKISGMPTKTQKQKKAQDAVYAELRDNVAEWITEWEDEDIMAQIEEVTHDMMLGKNGTVVERGMRGMIAMLKIVDGMDL